jgi:hypothetical protein
VLKDIIRRVLQPLTFKQNPNAESGYYNVLCADGNFKCANRFQQHGLQFAMTIATYIISRGMSVVGVIVQ